MKTFKKHPVNSEVVCITTEPISTTPPPLETLIIKNSEISLNPSIDKPLEIESK